MQSILTRPRWFLLNAHARSEAKSINPLKSARLRGSVCAWIFVRSDLMCLGWNVRIYKDEKEFTRDEIAKLAPIVASAEYQRMREEHTTAYRAVHLLRGLGENEPALARLVLMAAWEAEDRAMESLRQRYLEEACNGFMAQAKTLATHDNKWWSASILAAEIERQRRRFDRVDCALGSAAGLGPPVGRRKARGHRPDQRPGRKGRSNARRDQGRLSSA